MTYLYTFKFLYKSDSQDTIWYVNILYLLSLSSLQPVNWFDLSLWIAICPHPWLTSLGCHCKSSVTWSESTVSWPNWCIIPIHSPFFGILGYSLIWLMDTVNVKQFQHQNNMLRHKSCPGMKRMRARPVPWKQGDTWLKNSKYPFTILEKGSLFLQIVGWRKIVTSSWYWMDYKIEEYCVHGKCVQPGKMQEIVKNLQNLYNCSIGNKTEMTLIIT